MITQSAYNTKPPIKTVITRHRLFGSRKDGNISIGSVYDLTFTNQKQEVILYIEAAIKSAYDLGYQEASTYFLSKGQ